MKWISVKDRLPNNDDRVIICSMCAINDYCYPYNYEQATEMGFYSQGKWYSDTMFDILDESKIGRRIILKDNSCWQNLEDVTHWMPLPKQPYMTSTRKNYKKANEVVSKKGDI